MNKKEITFSEKLDIFKSFILLMKYLDCEDLNKIIKELNFNKEKRIKLNNLMKECNDFTKLNSSEKIKKLSTEMGWKVVNN